MKSWVSVVPRLMETALTLVCLIVLTFFLLRLLPGSPFDQDAHLNPVVQTQLAKSWALDQSPLIQLKSYFASVMSGDLGVSYFENRSVADILRSRFSATLALNFFGLMLTFILGFFIALMMSRKSDSLTAKSFEVLTVTFISLPSLFLGPLLIWIFAIEFDLLPVAFLDTPAHYILPVLTVSLRPAAVIARILAKSLRQAKQTDYMRTAKAKGLSEDRALIHHALRNSILPTLAASPHIVMSLLSGSFLVEVLFAIPGLGSAFVAAIANRDLPVVMGLTLFEGSLLIVISLAADLAIRALDPRLREVT